jgi:hypothetical protein
MFHALANYASCAFRLCIDAAVHKPDRPLNILSPLTFHPHIHGDDICCQCRGHQYLVRLPEGIRMAKELQVGPVGRIPSLLFTVCSLQT